MDNKIEVGQVRIFTTKTCKNTRVLGRYFTILRFDKHPYLGTSVVYVRYVESKGVEYFDKELIEESTILAEEESSYHNPLCTEWKSIECECWRGKI